MISKNIESISKRVAQGVLTACAVTMIAVVITTWIIYKEWIPTNQIGKLVAAVTVLSMFAGVITQMQYKIQMRIVIAAAIGVAYFLVLLGFNALIFSGRFNGMGVSLCLIVGTGVAAAFIGKKTERAGKHFKRKHKYR